MGDWGEATPFGFMWGPMVVERLAHIEGRGRVLEIRTNDVRLQIHVTEKGKKINVHQLPRRRDASKPAAS